MSPEPLIRQQDFTITGATIVTMNDAREVCFPGHVSVSRGAIAAIGPGSPERATGEPIDGSGKVVLPGFVNGHAHLVSVLTRGLGGDRFLTGGTPGGRERAYAIREALDEETVYAGTRLALGELLLSGVTTTTDSYAARRGLEDGLDGALRAWTEAGMRGIVHRASVDRTEIVPSHRHDSPDLALAELDRLSARFNSDLVTVGAEAMALHRVGDEMLDAVDDWARRHDAPFAMHISYNEEAAEYPVREYGRRLMTLLSDRGTLDARFLGHHPVWLDDEEVAAVAATGAGVSVCSAANMLIGLEPVPLRRLLDAGVRVSLGTDQPNDGHNFFEVMKTTLLQQRAVDGSTEFGSPELMLELATIGGARALHLDDRIGSIEVGKRGDLVVIDAKGPALAPLPARISNLVYAASPADVESVFIDGRQVVRDGRLTVWDGAEVVAEADRVVTHVLARAGLGPGPVTEWPVLQGDGDAG